VLTFFVAFFKIRTQVWWACAAALVLRPLSCVGTSWWISVWLLFGLHKRCTGQMGWTTWSAVQDTALIIHCCLWGKIEKALLRLVITKGYGVRMRATTMEGQNAFAPTLCVSFTWQIAKTRLIRLRGVEGRNARDEIALCAFHSLLVEVQTKAGYIHAWRLGLRVPLVALNPLLKRE